jgi:septum formation protein
LNESFNPTRSLRPRLSKPILLYSGSPRRAELLAQLGIDFEPAPFDTDESIPPSGSAAEIVSAIAEDKLRAGVLSHPEGLERWGIAADTLVESRSGLFGKPGSREEAAAMLAELSGCAHQVHTGISVHAPLLGNHIGLVQTETHSTKVFFKSLSAREISDYLESGEWNGVAGSYRIQGRGAVLVERIEGLWSTVVGLPLSPLYGILTAMSFPFG